MGIWRKCPQESFLKVSQHDLTDFKLRVTFGWRQKIWVNFWRSGKDFAKPLEPLVVRCFWQHFENTLLAPCIILEHCRASFLNITLEHCQWLASPSRSLFSSSLCLVHPQCCSVLHHRVSVAIPCKTKSNPSWNDSKYFCKKIQDDIIWGSSQLQLVHCKTQSKTLPNISARLTGFRIIQHL